MSTLTPVRPAARVEPPLSRRIKRTLAWRIFHAVQAVWLAAMVVAAVVSGPFLGCFVLWLVGAGVIATLGFGYREVVLYDHPSSSL